MSQTHTTSSVSETRGLERILGWLSALPVALIVALTFADVLGRYIFSVPVRGSVEMIEYAMALLIFSALPLVTRQRGHVTVSLIDNLFKGRARLVQLVLCDIISAGALALLTWRLFLQGQEDLDAGTTTIVLGLPHAPLSFALSLFAGISTLLILRIIGQTGQNKGDVA